MTLFKVTEKWVREERERNDCETERGWAGRETGRGGTRRERHVSRENPHPRRCFLRIREAERHVSRENPHPQRCFLRMREAERHVSRENPHPQRCFLRIREAERHRIGVRD
eukprot:62760-Chlamydomonas_euryale.AAC.2